jgi:hypothetical protein
VATECKAALFEFLPVEGRSVVGAFDGGLITSNAGGLLMGLVDRGLELMRRFARLLYGSARSAACGAQGGDAGGTAGFRLGAGLRGPQRSRRVTP